MIYLSYFDAIPLTIVTLGSCFLLIVQKYHKKIDVSPQVINTDTTKIRFSTVKRDVIKLGICIIQVSLFSLLLGRMVYENIDAIHAGLLVFCWLYATIITLIAKQSRAKNWRKTLNAHLTAIAFTAFLCSLWYLRFVFIMSRNAKRSEQIAAICNVISSFIVTAVASTTPRSPPLFDNGRPVTPICYSSILDFILFSTLNPLITKAYYKDALKESDLDQLPFDLRALASYHSFKSWRSKSLLYRIWNANKRIIIYQVIATMFVSLLYYVPSLFLYNFLEYIQENSSDRANNWDWGYVCILGMFISNILLLMSIGQQWYWSASAFNTSITGMFNAEIYAKSLKMTNGVCIDNVNEKDSSKDNNAAAVGKLINLMAVDTNRIGQFSMWWTLFFETPIQIIISLYFLYHLLGFASIIGFTFMIMILPLNHLNSNYLSNVQNKLMKARDHRISLMNEVLQGIRMIKLFAWERKWKERILAAREIELQELRKTFLSLISYNLIWLASPVIVTIIMFFVFTKVQGNELTASIAFTSITIFNELRFVLTNFPDVFMQGYQALISIRRIENFLNSKEIQSNKSNMNNDSLKIGFKNASVTWNEYNNEIGCNEFIMKDLNIEFPVGKLSVIYGHTGSGKTLLLMSLLGEIFFPNTPEDLCNPDPMTSDWILDNCVAFVAQESFLQNASIRSNITFGLPFHKERYNAVIKACALQRDFEILEDGDLTEIGEKGITISGGQKQRCALARAVYSRAKHIIIDDALSAVDAHTAKHLMFDCITGPLMEGRTRILVTHHVGLSLTKADYAVLLKDGKVEVSGTAKELKNSLAIETNNEVEDIIETVAENTNFQVPSNAFSDKSNEDEIRPIDEGLNSEGTTINEESDQEDSIVASTVRKDENRDSTKTKFPKKLIQAEEYAIGSVKFGIYMTYILANGHFWFWFMVTILFIITRLSQVAENWWLKVWSNAMSRLALLYYGSLRASRILYEALLYKIIRAPLRFFDTTPVGRILNRFSRDFETIDSTLTGNLALCLNFLLMMTGTVIVITAITKEFIIASLIFSVVYIIQAVFYTKCSRDLKRLESIAKSPTYTHFGETIIGISTIRAFGASKRFMDEILVRIDASNRPFYTKCTVNRWLSMRYNIMGAALTFIAGIFIILNLDKIDAGLAGLSLTFAMSFSKQIMWLVRGYTTFEMNLNSIERVCEFMEINQEAAEIIEPRPPASWPYDGNIRVEDLLIRYAPELEPVLHHISFEIFGQEKVGIVGRTGSGKSTISLSLFRFIEPSDGKIIIDGIDISSIGTIRSNLDTFSQCEDHELYESLRRVRLLPSLEEEEHLNSQEEDLITTLDDYKNINIFKNLDTPIAEGGKNLSQGQRQLLCLARALLKRSKIILMDEATASIDFDMDDKIQEMIRKEFIDCTVLCIAHRLRTVVDYDRILVLDQGNIIEFDSPRNLISNPNSLFYQMCQNSGEFDMLKSLISKNNDNIFEF
ncbi:9619_t:CDS:10 [Funneliformis caledonium]|uniref:9619_t:CDS:1 n=1 Tax=Funneliformis caledonium TaxID=1117310 RepID=A0A9N8V7Y5_9GLOM|nr:9619_t:CDS:10 [Funneliformis caledonium]